MEEWKHQYELGNPERLAAEREASKRSQKRVPEEQIRWHAENNERLKRDVAKIERLPINKRSSSYEQIARLHGLPVELVERVSERLKTQQGSHNK